MLTSYFRKKNNQTSFFNWQLLLTSMIMCIRDVYQLDINKNWNQRSSSFHWYNRLPLYLTWMSAATLSCLLQVYWLNNLGHSPYLHHKPTFRLVGIHPPRSGNISGYTSAWEVFIRIQINIVRIYQGIDQHRENITGYRSI